MAIFTAFFVLSLNISSYNQAIARSEERAQTPDPSATEPADQEKADPSATEPADQEKADPSAAEPDAQEKADPSAAEPADQEKADPSAAEPDAQEKADPSAAEPDAQEEAAQVEPTEKVILPFYIVYPQKESRYVITFMSLNKYNSKLSAIVLPEDRNEPPPIIELRASLSGVYSLKTEGDTHTIAITTQDNRTFFYQLSHTPYTKLLDFEEGQKVEQGTIIAEIQGSSFTFYLTYGEELSPLCLSHKTLPSIPYTRVVLEDFAEQEDCPILESASSSE